LHFQQNIIFDGFQKDENTKKFLNIIESRKNESLSGHQGKIVEFYDKEFVITLNK